MYVGHRSLQAAAHVELDDYINKECQRRTGGGVDGCDIGRVFAEDDGKAGLEMEVDVAMEEPWAGVVGLDTRSRSGLWMTSRCKIARTVKRMVTLSPAVPVFTTSRRTGLT